MSVKSISEYIAVSQDVKEKFNGNQLNYVCWDHHLLFASAFLLFVSPDVLFKDMVNDTLVPLLQPDPEAKNINWSTAKWLKANESWTPDFDKTLAENGIVHKDQLRFQTDELPALGAG